MTARILFTCLPLFVSMVPSSAQGRSVELPRFEDYPAREIFAGTPASPRLATRLDRTYEAQIRQGVENGWGVLRDGKEQQGPNFAGRLIVVQWGCGSPCMRMAIVDARNGRLHYPPISFNGIGIRSFDLPLLSVGHSVPRNPEVRFRRDSNLMIMKATPKQSGRGYSYAYCFLWQKDHWTLLRRVPLEQ